MTTKQHRGDGPRKRGPQRNPGNVPKDSQARDDTGRAGGHPDRCTDAPAALRDQRWAFYAYEAVASVRDDQRTDYKIAINDFGANILRSGLSAALAAIERLGTRAELVLDHLARAEVAGLEGATARDLPSRVRRLDVDAYMLATREMLRVAAWLKRATQAMLGDD